MKLHQAILVSIFLVLAPVTLSWADENPDTKSEKVHKRTHSFNTIVGFAPLFMNMEQFNDDTDAIGVDNLIIPVELRIGWYTQRYWGNHIFRSGNLFTFSNTSSHKNGRLASLTTGSFSLDLGYGYRIIPAAEYYIDTGIGASGWAYELISPMINGRATGWNFGLRPETGFQFIIVSDMVLRIFGGYQFDLVPIDEHLYSGDFTGENFNKINFNRAFAGFDFGIWF